MADTSPTPGGSSGGPSPGGCATSRSATPTAPPRPFLDGRLGHRPEMPSRAAIWPRGFSHHRPENVSWGSACRRRGQSPRPWLGEFRAPDDDTRKMTFSADRPVPARHHLPAGLRDRPLRFPLRLLHVGKHDLSAGEWSLLTLRWNSSPGLLVLRASGAPETANQPAAEPLVRRGDHDVFQPD